MTEDKLRAAMIELPYEQREAVMLRLHADMKFREIAKYQNISVKTALSRYRYGLDKPGTKFNGWEKRYNAKDCHRRDRDGRTIVSFSQTRWRKDYYSGDGQLLLNIQWFVPEGDTGQGPFEPKNKYTLVETKAELGKAEMEVTTGTDASFRSHPMSRIMFLAGLIDKADCQRPVRVEPGVPRRYLHTCDAIGVHRLHTSTVILAPHWKQRPRVEPFRFGPLLLCTDNDITAFPRDGGTHDRAHRNTRARNVPVPRRR